MGSGPGQTGISGLLVVVAAPTDWAKSLVLPMGTAELGTRSPCEHTACTVTHSRPTSSCPSSLPVYKGGSRDTESLRKQWKGQSWG